MVSGEGRPKADGRIVLDDINWRAISQTVATRTPGQCMEKWYHSLAPSMVARGALL